MTGRSRPLDPRTNAVRPDIADVRLAAYVFAPHYAAAVARTVSTEATLRAGRPVDSETLATLAAGEPFELLDVTGGDGWGIATRHGLVGYLDASILGQPE
ncbi:SH3 domain-containing protein [uncultured Sphingomonas sp.]|uniref:SH3 domain-containing protein n=1 Tax=uncultured Sphingomonas sp. TaxID=158754 RepID=UPI0026154A88|nr:SH3 domain-containing protein [uncultured Sphingomonas sp.]